MQYRLLHRLGQLDARKCNESFGASLSLDASKLGRGCVIELNDQSLKYLTGKKPAGRGHIALLEPTNKVKGEAKQPEVTAPGK